MEEGEEEVLHGGEVHIEAMEVPAAEDRGANEEEAGEEGGLNEEEEDEKKKEEALQKGGVPVQMVVSAAEDGSAKGEEAGEEGGHEEDDDVDEGSHRDGGVEDDRAGEEGVPEGEKQKEAFMRAMSTASSMSKISRLPSGDRAG